VGSQLGSLAYHAGGWIALTLLGAALPVLALVGWSTEQGEHQRTGHDLS
jgi:predicted MFS family arabinose efflux permease